jgi:DNA-binding NtrC family response regulator
MSKRKGTVLIIDDEEEIRESIEFLLNSEGMSTEVASTGEEGLKKIEENHYDLVLLDLMLPGRSGMEVQKDIKQVDPTLPVVIITAIGALETAVTAIKEGSFDYITKPWNNEKLIVIAKNAIKQRQLMSENLQLRRALKERFGYSNIVGKSEKMLKMLDLVTQVAGSRSTILIQGESGTGKELIAKAIHLKSQRADKAFVPVNSGSMPVDLLESTLFGHVKGAFTSAIASKKGLFEVADQGTIFFDEIGTISMETQAKLLRVIQEKEFMRLGAVETIKVDARIIAATNADLKQLVDDGRFREDLYYRLNVINIQLPPLRDRKEDVPALVEFFTKKYCDENAKPLYRFSSEALKVLMDYHWPGNVRELENVVERAVVLSQDEIIGRDLLPEAIISPSLRFATLSSFPLSKETSLFEIIDSFERRVIIEMLEQTGWSQTDAADNFKIPLSTLNQKIKRHGIEIKKKRERPAAVPTTSTKQ